MTASLGRVPGEWVSFESTGRTEINRADREMKKFMAVMGAFILVFILVSPSRATPIYDLSVSGSFSGMGQIEFAADSGSSVGDVNSFSFTVDSQLAPGTPCAFGCAPLPITFGLSDIQSISWTIDPNDSSLSFELETFTKILNVGDYDLSFDTASPFNPSTTIKYSVGQAVHVELTVFDLLGRQVSSLVNEAQTAGEYSINFNGKGLASGVYFVRLTAGDFVESAKVILAK